MINIKRFRKIQTIASIAIFILVFLMCWKFTPFNIENIQLSYWGVDNELGVFWNACLCMLAISIYFNAHFFIENHPRAKYKRTSQKFFQIVSLFLFFTGAINMHHWIHTPLAALYFLSCPLAIFWFAHLNRKHLHYKEWMTHLIVSVCMVIAPIIALNLFHGMAIAETVHASMVVGWNIWILFED